MRARYGRDIYCQVCGKDDKIYAHWLDQFAYQYRCGRCNVKVKEIDQKKSQITNIAEKEGV